MNTKQGFTLVELIIVIAIIAILSTVAIPQFKGYIESARRTEAIAAGDEIYCAAIWSYQKHDGIPSELVIASEVRDITGIYLQKVEFSTAAGILKLYYNIENRNYYVEAYPATNTYFLKETESGIIVLK